MGWDIWPVVELDGKHVSLREGWNYTHNCNDMIRLAGFPEWDSDSIEAMSGAEVRDKLRAVIRELEDNPAKYDAMNPPNGWGSRQTLLPVLRGIVEFAAEYPSCRWHASF